MAAADGPGEQRRRQSIVGKATSQTCGLAHYDQDNERTGTSGEVCGAECSFGFRFCHEN